MVSLGTYPDVPLKLARERRDERRKGHAAGTTPSDQLKAEKATKARRAEGERLAASGLPGLGTFEHTARAWHAYMLAGWAPSHGTKVLAPLENDLLPHIGAWQLSDITAPQLLVQARRVEARGASETAYRALKVAGAVFRFGVQQGLCESDPSRDLKGAVLLPAAQHRAADQSPGFPGVIEWRASLDGRSAHTLLGRWPRRAARGARRPQAQLIEPRGKDGFQGAPLAGSSGEPLRDHDLSFNIHIRDLA